MKRAIWRSNASFSLNVVLRTKFLISFRGLCFLVGGMVRPGNGTGSDDKVGRSLRLQVGCDMCSSVAPALAGH